MNKPHRKANRILDFDYSQDGVYFITICTDKRRHILSSITKNGTVVLLPCGEIAKQLIESTNKKFSSVYIDNYVIMPDHIHLLVRIETKPDIIANNFIQLPTIGTIVGWFKYQLTKEINQRLNTPGEKQLQRSYYDHVIRNQQDYNEAFDYIAYNPLNWLKKGQ